jgi:hypothetical protein
MVMINSLVLEEKGSLIIGAGLFPDWLKDECQISIGNVHTVYGPLQVNVTSNQSEVAIEWDGRWYSKVPDIEVRIPCTELIKAEKDRTSIKIERKVKR